MTSCKDAIRIFAENRVRNPPGPDGEQKPVEEIQQVKLYFMTPPITKLDPAALSTLKECTHLALSSNNIDRLVNLGALEKLEILSIGRNNIKKFEHLDAIADHLEQIWASYNSISSLGGLEKCNKLRVLYVGNCKINDMKEINRLAAMPSLEEFVGYGNPIYNKIIEDGDLAWPIAVLKALPNIKKIDGIPTIEWKVKISEGNEKQLMELFKSIDTDGSGDLSIAEMKAAFRDDDIRREMGVSKDNAETVFAQMDDDDSGSITWDEFRTYFSTKQDLANLL